MDTRKASILLTRYQQGETSAEENLLVESWLMDTGAGSAEWSGMDELSRKRYLSDLYADINSLRPAGGADYGRIYKLRFWRKISSIAALFLIACGLYLSWPALNQWISPVSYHVNTTVRTPELLILQDGSRVWLNAASSLKYPSRFAGNAREVYLEGEAFFEVAHDKEKPFLVHTKSVTTRVLGTVFTVRAYPEDADTRIILKSGKVRVVAKDQEKSDGILIYPGQMVSYKAGGQLLKTNIPEANDYSSWKEGKLIFNETPVSEALQRIGRAYGVAISFKDEKIKECAITGSFNVNQELEDILRSISISVDGKFTRKANQITFSGEGCN